jgi:hypothetical protein
MFETWIMLTNKSQVFSVFMLLSFTMDSFVFLFYIIIVKNNTTRVVCRGFVVVRGREGYLLTLPLSGNALMYIVTCMSDSQQGFGLEMGFIDHFKMQLVTALNYSASANPLTLQITRAHRPIFSSLLCLHQSFLCNGF